MLIELSDKQLKLIDLSLKYTYETGVKFAQFDNSGINETRQNAHLKLISACDKLRRELAKQYKTIKGAK